MGRPSDAPDRISYRYTPYRDEWDAWKRTVPRRLSLHDRLDELRDIDQRYDLRTAVAAVDERVAADAAVGGTLSIDDIDAALESPPDDAGAVKVAALRIRRRCMTALPAARTNGCDRAADEISEIKQLADSILER